MSPKDLVKALAKLPAADSERLLVGPSTLDDAGVVRLSDEVALVQTVDFFPPIVDDPRYFGRIAAANSLSDVYAMGGVPHSCLSIVGWPKELDPELLGEILAGGQDKIDESGAVLAGGHTVTDGEIKYGLSVTGTIHPGRILSNAGAKPGDQLVLTKCLGMGALSTAIGKNKLPEDIALAAMEQMATLKKSASDAALRAELVAATDVTGFGLLGHACEIARASQVSIEIDSEAVPAFEAALPSIQQGLASGGWGRALDFLADELEIEGGVDEARKKLCLDAETSGGLLLAVPEDRVDSLLQDLEANAAPCAVLVGRVTERRDKSIYLRR